MDEFNIPNLQEPKERLYKGSLIQDHEILNNFDYIAIYHNENKYPHKTFLSVPNVNYEDFVQDEQNEILMITPDENTKKVELFVAFQANMVSNSQGMTMMPQFILQKYDFNQFQLVQNVKTLNK